MIKTFNIDDLTLGQIKEISSLVPQVKQGGNDECCPYLGLLNKKIFIRTVTFYYTGILREIFNDTLILEDVSWIPDTGRFSEALKTGKLDEVEPFSEKEIRIGRGGIMDVSEFQFELPLIIK